MQVLSRALLVGLMALPGMGVPMAAQQAVPAPASGDAAQASSAEIAKLQSELAARPGWTEGWWQLSTTAYDADHFEVAAGALQHVVQGAPQMGLAWNLLGLSEFELKHYDEAQTDLARAAQLRNSEDPEVERVAAYHLALLLVRGRAFDRATDLLLTQFSGAPNNQVIYALGLAALHVPLLPAEVDPAQEPFIVRVGTAVAQGKAGLPALATLAAEHADVPYLRNAYGLALVRAGQGAEGERVLRDDARLHAAKASDESLRTRYGLKAAAGTAVGWGDAMQAYAGGDYGKAAAALTAWVSQHPDDGTAWAVLGLSEFGLRQYDSALLHLERGESLGLHGDPRALATAEYTAGCLLLRSGDFDHAAEILTAAHKREPADGRIVDALGLSLLRRGGLPGAGQDEALLHQSGELELLLQDSRYDEAFAGFRALLQRYPSTAHLHYAYGTALIAMSEFDEAAAQMQAELRLSPDDALAYVRLASIAVRQHKPQEALAPGRKAVALAPDSAEAHYLLGRALLETGADAPAITELEAARALNPGSPEVHFSLARAYTRADRAKDAGEERATFLRLSELVQKQRSGPGAKQGAGQGGAVYSGPHEGATLTGAAAGPGAPP